MSLTPKGLILGCYGSSSSSLILTKSAKEFDAKTGGKLVKLLQLTNFDAKLKKTRALFQLSEEYGICVVTGLGDESSTYCPVEEIDLKLENIRVAITKAIKVCEDHDVTHVTLDDCSHPKCVGEASALSNYEWGCWKSKEKSKVKSFTLLSTDEKSNNDFNEGLIFGEAQMFAANLAETPSNLKMPRKIAEVITSQMPSNVQCITRDKDWIINKKMNMFLSVNQGSVEPPVLLEAHYKGNGVGPIVLVGKGITFDSGGISIKMAAGMADMKADMMGAATVFACIKAIALMKLPIHVIGIAPFTENLPSGSATRPGDVYESMSGKTVEVDNTDAEGRLVLGDALTYAESLNPIKIIDLATLTGAVGVALGSATSAIYTKSDQMLKDFKKAASISGDRVWHMPLYKEYSRMIESKVADLINSTKKREAGSCTAAAFLSEFVKTGEWAHIDIAGVMITDKESIPYSPGGMSGRPTRTLIEYIKLQAK